MKIIRNCSIVLVSLLLLCGCGTKEEAKNKILSGKEAKVEVINNSALLVDVRSSEEYAEEHLGGAVSLPLDEIESLAETRIPSKDKIVIVYCASGKRSKEAQEKLKDLGYKTVYNLGAMSNWYE